MEPTASHHQKIEKVNYLVVTLKVLLGASRCLFQPILVLSMTEIHSTVYLGVYLNGYLRLPCRIKLCVSTLLSLKKRKKKPF